MVLDLKQVPTTLNGDKVTDNEKELTLGVLIVRALMGVFPDEASLSGEEKVRRYKLAMKIHEAETVELSLSDVELIKKLIGKMFTTALVYPLWKLLDPSSV